VAIVLGGAAEHFGAGFDLKLFAAAIEAADWTAIDAMLSQFQQTLLGLKYAAVPVVCAVGGYTLGGGCEVMLHAAGVQAAFESSIGLPESNVGLIPAGGGTTQMLLRASAAVPPGTVLEPADPFPFLQPVWDKLRLGRYSASSDEARELGYLREEDGVTRHPDRLLHDAKEHALALAADYRPPAPATACAMGRPGLARFQWEIHLLHRADRIAEHDARIALGLARVLCGGDLLYATEVTEQYVLDLEREVFLQLAGTPETLARIRHMLTGGKQLRN
jgi:3-hydroxyacyl-CoA dehydrogenase